MAERRADLPEFHLVVRRPGRGPIAPYRFPTVVAFTMLVTGRELLHAAQTAEFVDEALLRSGVAGLLAWFVLGRVDTILKGAESSSTRPARLATHEPDADV